MKTAIAAALLATAASLPGTALAASTGAQAATAPAQPVRYNARQFFETTSFGMASSEGVAYSSDGRNLLISSDRTGVFNVYALPVAGGEPVQITRSTTNATVAVSYFPNDGRILFTADQGGNELNHIYVRLPDGTDRDLTPGQNLKAQFVGWNQDGRTFYIATNEREAAAFDIYAYDAATLERRLIYRNPGGFMPMEISRDGRWIGLSKANTSADSDVYLAEVGSDAAPRHVTPHQGNVAFGLYGFTPDSRSLIYGTNETSEFDQAVSYTIDGGARAPLIAADWDVMFVMYSPSALTAWTR